MPLVGEPFKNGFPWSEPPKAASPTHPFLRKWAAMFALGERSPTPATLTLGRKHRGKDPPLCRPLTKGDLIKDKEKSPDRSLRRGDLPINQQSPVYWVIIKISWRSAVALLAGNEISPVGAGSSRPVRLKKRAGPGHWQDYETGEIWDYRNF